MMIGSDPDSLDRLGGVLAGLAALVDNQIRPAAWTIRNLDWHGRDGDRYRVEWSATALNRSSRDRSSLAYADTFLRRQAEAQRHTSAASTVTMPEVGALTEAVQQGTAAAMAGADPAAQAAWWKSLDEDERRHLLETQPGLIAGMAGLPDDVRREAAIAFVSQDAELAENVFRDALEREVSINGNVAWVHFGADLSASTFQNLDGTFTVELALSGEIGGHFGNDMGSGAVGVRGGVSQQYRFATQAEADAFLRGLAEAAAPSGTDWLKPWSGFDVVGDTVDYLRDNSDVRTSNTLSGAVFAEGDIELQLGGDKIELDGSAALGIAYDLDSGDGPTYFVEAEVNGVLSLPNDFAFAGGASLLTELATDSSGNVTNLMVRIDGTFMEGGTASAIGGTGVEYSTQLTGGVAAGMVFDLDLTDPANRQLALDVLSSGGVPSADTMQALYNNSTVVLSSGQVVHSSAGFEAEGGVAGISVEVTGTATDNSSVSVKPPRGDFIDVMRV
jgi:hypothetical protein